MTIYLLMIPALIAGHPNATTPHWHRTHAACRADERAHHMPRGSCLPTRGPLPGPVVSLDSDGE